MSYKFQRFWNVRGLGFTDYEWGLILNETQQILKNSNQKLTGKYGSGPPDLLAYEIAFQGSPGNEPFIFSRYANFSSCDTAGLPYDEVVTSILALAKKVSSDKIEVPWFLDNAPLYRKYAKKWETLPKGWTDESRKKFWDSLTKGAPKHKVTQCINKMEGKFDDPGAFCASLADRVTPGWRSKVKKKPNS